NLSAAEGIYNFFQLNNVNRSSMIYGIGGGITTDIAAFAASTYMRGCRLSLVPTTFLAMIDSTIGGKTALNYKGIKNNLGTFYPAEKVHVCPNFLSTLPENELRNGWAEAIKISLIGKTDLYEEILNSNRKISDSIIARAIDLKLRLCNIDPEDKQERRILNLGHTFGHIIEKLTDFSTPHGMAVSLGIRAAAQLSFQEGYLTAAEVKKITRVLDYFKFPSFIAIKQDLISQEQFKQILHLDKKSSYKNKKIEINLIVFEGFQKAVQKVFPLEKIYQVIQELIKPI
ncbi:MAG: hypothetical protein APR54_03000, partial [Candidatus Cloacimonas sp. SDB]